MKKFTLPFCWLVLFGFSSFGQHTLTLEDAVLNGRKYYPQGLIMPQWVPATDAYSHRLQTATKPWPSLMPNQEKKAAVLLPDRLMMP
jgi:hypothetical protein